MTTTATPPEPQTKSMPPPPAETANADSRSNSAIEALSPEVQKIISRGQRRESRQPGFLRTLSLSLVSAVLLWCVFTPMQFGFMAWFALVPLVSVIRVQEQCRGVKRATFIGGFLWAVATLQWMRLGHPTMYFALLGMSLYIAFYFPVFVALSRGLVHRLNVPVLIAVPVVWTALEFLRAYLGTGFAWYFLGHSQYRWLSLIQMADVTGVYGITFLIVMANAALAMLIPEEWFRRFGVSPEAATLRNPGSRLKAVGVVATLVLLAISVGYGVIRQNTTFEDGPKVAIVQGSVEPQVKHDPGRWLEVLQTHDRLSLQSARYAPDLVIWPETMFPQPDQVVADGLTDADLLGMMPPGMAESDRGRENVRNWRSGDTRQFLANRSAEIQSAMMIGLQTHVAQKDRIDAFNSAAFVRPDTGYVGRYDKMHRVIFGEYIPLKDIFPWLGNLTPYGSSFGIEAGESAKSFEFADTNFVPVICFEDTVPHLMRRISNEVADDGKPADVFLNLTNDGWFRGSSELDQHLITASFRCIELRTPMVRAVNGGISAVIDGNGSIRDPAVLVIEGEPDAEATLIDPDTGKWRRGFDGLMVSTVPLDRRSSFYQQFGDWFAWICLTLTIVGGIAARIRGQVAAIES